MASWRATEGRVGVLRESHDNKMVPSLDDTGRSSLHHDRVMKLSYIKKQADAALKAGNAKDAYTK